MKTVKQYINSCHFVEPDFDTSKFESDMLLPSLAFPKVTLKSSLDPSTKDI